MKLEEFVGKRKVNITQLAESIGYSRCHLQGVVNGRFKAGKKLAKALEIATEGKLKAEDLLKADKEMDTE